MTTMTIAQARSQFAEVINRVNYGGERFLITRRGKPIAAIGHVEDLEFIEQRENEIDLREARKALRAYERNPKSAIPYEEFRKTLGLDK